MPKKMFKTTHMYACLRDNLCYDCEDKRCFHAGDKGADCPKYTCDNPNGIDECDNCEFIDNFIEMSRNGENKDMYDQSIKADAGKEPLTTVPRKGIWAVARVRDFGIRKYKAKESWRTVEKERYRDAAMRHFFRYLDNPTGLDEESGLPHIAHCICNLLFLYELEDFDEKTNANETDL